MAAPRSERLDWLFFRNTTAGRIMRSAKLFSNGMLACSKKVKMDSPVRRRRWQCRTASRSTGRPRPPRRRTARCAPPRRGQQGQRRRLEKLNRLPPPDADPLFVDRILPPLDVLHRESPTEVAGRGRIDERQADSGLAAACNHPLRAMLMEAAHRLKRFDDRWKGLAGKLKSRGQPGSVIAAGSTLGWVERLAHRWGSRDGTSEHPLRQPLRRRAQLEDWDRGSASGHLTRKGH